MLGDDAGDGTPEPGTTSEGAAAHNRVAVPAMVAEHRDRLLRAWQSQRPICPVVIWLVADLDGSTTGAGATGGSAWTSALETEILAMAGDDSCRHAESIEALEAEIVSRAGHHRIAQMSMAFALGGVEVFAQALDVRPGGRIYVLIESAARAAD